MINNENDSIVALLHLHKVKFPLIFLHHKHAFTKGVRGGGRLNITTGGRVKSSGDADTQTRTQTGEASDLSRLSCVCCTLPYPLVSLPSSAEVFLSTLVFFSPSFLSGLSVFTAAFLGAIEKEREIKKVGERGARVGARMLFCRFS